MPRDVEVAVVGAGVVGAATAHELAGAGRSVALLEQFELAHARGSSHGTSRIFRLSYPDERYVRLAREALARWRKLEAECGETLIVQTGSLDLGAIATENAPALAAGGVAHERLTGADVTARWGIAARSDEPALFHSEGGITRADRAHAVFLEGARTNSVDVRERTRVATLHPDHDAVEVEAESGMLRAGAVVVAAGGWARELVEPLGIDLPVTVTRETTCYFPLESAGELPPVIDGTSNGRIAYALAAPGLGLKAGLHHAGPETDPNLPGEPDPGLVAAAAEWVAERYPGAGQDPLRAETCLYTNTLDESFVLERHDRVVVGSACSGHGFKFAPVVGARLAQLAAEAL
jgi:sarcosine oxidase